MVQVAGATLDGVVLMPPVSTDSSFKLLDRSLTRCETVSFPDEGMPDNPDLDVVVSFTGMAGKPFWVVVEQRGDYANENRILLAEVGSRV